MLQVILIIVKKYWGRDFMTDYKLKEILQLAERYTPQMSRFLRDMIAIPSESCGEKAVIQRIKQEMEDVGFDKVVIDPMGNILGFIGHGQHIIAMDAHIDTVGIGNKDLWNYDPYEGYEDDEIILGRGASDQEGGMAAMVYAGKIIKDLGLEDDYTLIVTGTVQEEDCDGLCWQYIIEEDKIKPEFVVLTEPTSCNIYRGHRGRMEIKVTTHGISCHGSAPERGDNAIFKMAPILSELEKLSDKLGFDEFLGKGTLTVSEIFFSSPSRCAVADQCTISIDRRLTAGETWEGALREIMALPSVATTKAEVSMYNYSRESYTDLVYPTECYFPTWVIPEEHEACQTLVECYKRLFEEEPLVDKWTFSTNGVSIMGRYGVPCIGFGPGHEDQAHAPNEKTWKKELAKCAAMYSLIPIVYLREYINKGEK
jgi:putative selenium metabolism hydrolase